MQDFPHATIAVLPYYSIHGRLPVSIDRNTICQYTYAYVTHHGLNYWTSLICQNIFHFFSYCARECTITSQEVQAHLLGEADFLFERLRKWKLETENLRYFIFGFRSTRNGLRNTRESMYHNRIIYSTPLDVNRTMELQSGPQNNTTIVNLFGQSKKIGLVDY